MNVTGANNAANISTTTNQTTGATNLTQSENAVNNTILSLGQSLCENIPRGPIPIDEPIIGNSSFPATPPSLPHLPVTPFPFDTGISSSSTTASAYNQLMQDLSASGTSADSIKNDAANLEAALQNTPGDLSNGTSDLLNATQNIVNSLNDGTFSKQGSQGALEGAAWQDGLIGQNILRPNIVDGGGAEQRAGLFDPNQNPNGSLGANVNILNAMMENNASPSDIANNATALMNEAAQSGKSGLAAAAQNIVNSLSDGTYNAQTSHAALTNSLNVS
ncbi:hypothetical protein [Burkholderia metallica]|uniref:hypothetical protein n=1 Tax=Burkholderia metallica TaxID=488729 RepID=UPI001CF45357|nr:hypothetical protein [Burkholderia metallica]MCA8023439.1 hypothetical protein [Burkholderia metallica]